MNSGREGDTRQSARSVQRKQRIMYAAVGLIVSAIGVVILSGWLFDIALFQTDLLGSRLINPLEGIAAIILGAGYIGISLGRVGVLKYAAGAVALMGAGALLPIFGFDLLLFGSKVQKVGAQAYFSDLSAVCFVIIGAIEVTARRQKIVRQISQYESFGLVLIILILLINIYSRFYLHDSLIAPMQTLLMPALMCIVFLAVVVGKFFLTSERTFKGVFTEVTGIGWLVLGFLVIAQVTGYLSWSSVVARNEHDSYSALRSETDVIKNEIASSLAYYQELARSYQGLFAANSIVAEDQFRSFSRVVNGQNFAALQSVMYAEQDTTSRSGWAYKTIYLQGRERLLPTTDTPSNSLWPSYNAAVARNAIVIQPSNLSSQQGDSFLVIAPVKQGKNKKNGVVVLKVLYSSFFAQHTYRYGLDRDLDISVRTSNVNNIVFRKADKAGQDSFFIEEDVLAQEKSLWRISVAAPRDFRLNEAQRYLPFTILVVTQIFSVLLVVVFVLYARARTRAQNLIAAATSELQQQRNYALELHKKDEAIIAGIADGLVVLDRHGRVQLINAAGREILGLPLEQRLGVGFETILRAYEPNGQVIPLSKRPIEIALTKGKTVSKTIYYSHKSGRIFPAQVRVSPIVQNNETIGAIQLFRDVTKDFELDKAKSEFVALASHQLRTPLSAVNWFSEMLLDGDAGKLNKTQQEYINEIYQGNKRMISLINDLLDVSRMELGKLVNEPVKLNVKDVVESVRRELEMDAAARAIHVQLSLADHLPPVFADEKMVRIIVQNLMSNAVKYTSDKGSVEVVLRKANHEETARHAKSSHKTFLYFSVKDTGYGIPKAQQEKIFQKLFRADNVRKLDVEGTGLGLYMTKQVTETLGGHIWFESIESIGTTFTVLLPVNVPKSSH